MKKLSLIAIASLLAFSPAAVAAAADLTSFATKPSKSRSLMAGPAEDGSGRLALRIWENEQALNNTLSEQLRRAGIPADGFYAITLLLPVNNPSAYKTRGELVMYYSSYFAEDSERSQIEIEYTSESGEVERLSAAEGNFEIMVNTDHTVRQHLVSSDEYIDLSVKLIQFKLPTGTGSVDFKREMHLRHNYNR